VEKGFVDIQVNGYKGVGFAAPGLTIDGVASVTRELLRQGTVAYCPTVSTCAMEVYRENLPVLARAMEDSELGERILGIHIEGPFISPDVGARGAHEEKWIRPPDINLYEELRELASGKIVMFTLAPEVDGAEKLIKHIAKDGNVAVCLGHHIGGKADIEQAVKAGARSCTHLGNGIPNVIHRHENPLWTELAEDRLMASFITDGHHLPYEFIITALRAKTAKRFIVTSDVAMLGGMPPGTYEKGNSRVVIEESGKLRMADGDYLAGSSSTMLDCMNVLASLGELDEKELWDVGLYNPLRLAGKEINITEPGAVEFRDGRFCMKE